MYDINEFHKNGYLLIKNFYSKEELSEIINEISQIGSFIYKDNFDLYKAYNKKHLEKQKSLYNCLRYLVSLNKFASSNKNLNLAKSLGLIHPCIMNSCNIRMDTPENKNLFHWHQDTTYLLGSLNALTFWIPLTKVNLKNGTIEFIPQTHDKGFYPFESTINSSEIENRRNLSPKDIRLIEEPNLNVKYIEANIGDLVVLYQMLLHRSTPTNSNFTRWSIQLRYSDLMNENFLNANYPFGDTTNIYKSSYI